MYQQIILSDHTLVGAPGPVPSNLAGLSDAVLSDLSAAIQPPPPGLAGQGFWPVVVTTPSYDATKRVPDGTFAYAADTANGTVTGTANLRALTAAELASALAAAQAAQVVTLSAACGAQIVGGFTSSALGAAHTYPSKATDQDNLSASVLSSLMPNLPANWTTPFWCADASGAWSYQAHTVAQIQQAGLDGKAAILAAQEKLVALNAKVAAAATVADVVAVTW